MTDNFHLAQKNFVQFIYNSSNWQKPRGITMVHIIAIGAGGGGGGGHTAATGSAKSGGGGGASGGVSRLYIPANLCPENLKITIGNGGNGGAASSNGTVGGATIIEPFRTIGTSATYLLIANGGGAGGGGNAVARGIAGTGGIIATTTSANYSNEGVLSLSAGQDGDIGGAAAGTVGVSQDLSTQTSPFSGGAGGGGAGTSNNNGGNQTGFADIVTVPGGTVTIPNGGDGFFRLNPFYSTGGAGGYGNNVGSGGNGGNGALCCGGGGGGAGTTGGRGGNGGNGLVIITCW
jgi:hypothetical protein